MPIQEGLDKKYTKNTRIYINTDDGVAIKDGYKRYQIDEIREVYSIEMSGFYTPNDIIPTFVARNGEFSGNNIFELRLDDLDTGDTSTFIIELDERRFYPSFVLPSNPPLDTRSLDEYMENIVKRAIVYDPHFGSPGSEAFNTPPSYFNFFTFFLDNDPGNYEFYMEFVTSQNVTATVLFGSGSRKDDSCASVLGFPNTDLFFNDLDEATGPNPITFKTGRFVEVRVKEAREFNPLSRFFLQNDNLEDENNRIVQYQNRNEINFYRPRILASEPPFRMRALTVSMMIDGTRPVPASVEAHLEFNIYSISNEETVPDWASDELLSI